MMAQLRGIRIDENETEKRNTKITLRKPTNVKDSKRAALGELGNRALPKNNEVQKENLSNSKAIDNLKNIKPRVDTHWKKATLATKKIVTRSDSLKSLNGGVTTNAGAKNTLPTTNKTTFNPKAVNKDKILNVNVVQAKPEEKQITAIRREDSNLSRRSLSKLRAALSKDHKKEKNEAKIAKVKPGILVNNIESHSTALLNEVENIDSDDSSSPYLVSEYVNDIYDYLYHLEATFPIKENHLQNQVDVTPKMRAVLIDWINEVHFQFHLVPETFHMTVGIIDRYLQEVQTTLRKNLQLVGVTALYIAAKFEEMYPPLIGDLIYITDDTYNKEQMHEMEIRIIKVLDFQIGRPLAIHFLRRFSKAANGVGINHLLSKYFIELATVDYSLCQYRPSEIAAASLFLALKLLDKEKTPNTVLWTATLQHYSRYSIEHLTPIVKKIATLVRDAPNTKLIAVYSKYKSSKFERVSLRPELKGQKIEQICTQ